MYQPAPNQVMVSIAFPKKSEVNEIGKLNLTEFKNVAMSSQFSKLHLSGGR
jgi:hypothetical protein